MSLTWTYDAGWTICEDAVGYHVLDPAGREHLLATCHRVAAAYLADRHLHQVSPHDYGAIDTTHPRGSVDFD